MKKKRKELKRIYKNLKNYKILKNLQKKEYKWNSVKYREAWKRN